MALPRQVEEAGKAADDALGINTSPETTTPETKPVEADTVEGQTARIAELEADLEKEKHKYSVLQGKYNAEIKPIKDDVNLLNNLKSQNKNLEKKTAEFQRKVADLVTQNAEFARANSDLQNQLAGKKKESPAEDETLDITKLLSEEDQEILIGEGITGTAQDVFVKLVSKLTHTKKTNEPTASEPAKVQNESVVDSFWTGLEDAVADWQPINRSPEFNTWLDELAPYSDKTKRQLLTEAQDKLDLTTVISIFGDFKASDSFKPEQAPQSPSEPTETTPETNLENELEPESSAQADVIINPPGQSPEEKMLDPKYVFSPSEITAFYKNATQSGSLMESNRELYDKIDAAIVTAGAEGRVAKT